MTDLRPTVLRVDAVFLAVAGVFGLVGDILSYTSRVTLWRSSDALAGTFGNWLGLSAHLVLGGSNIIRFDVVVSGAKSRGRMP
jgi:hypothetical protein